MRQQPLAMVVLKQRTGLLVIDRQALLDDLRLIVFALDRLAAALTAAQHAGEIVDMDRKRLAGTLADPPAAQPPDNLAVVDVKRDHPIEGAPIVCKREAQAKRLTIRGGQVSRPESALKMPRSACASISARKSAMIA